MYRAISHSYLSMIGIELSIIYPSRGKGGTQSIGVFVAPANDFLEVTIHHVITDLSLARKAGLGSSQLPFLVV